MPPMLGIVRGQALFSATQNSNYWIAIPEELRSERTRLIKEDLSATKYGNV